MNCPACGAELRKKFFGRIEMNACEACGGYWLPRGNVSGVIKQYMKYIAERNDREVKKIKRLNPWEVETKTRTCPECGQVMKKLNYSYNSNVIVDSCDFCEGTWFDRGEIEAIARFLKYNGMPEKLKKEFEEIRAVYDAHERREALDILGDAITWILSFIV